MKRFIMWWVGVMVALTCACTQTNITLQAAGLQGAYDLALVNDLLFVTSTANDELRVLTLDADVNKRGFVRAPNPIEPLSIPVLTRPQALARDIRYVGGDEQPGPYVYARSNGSSIISVVASSRDVLREVLQLDTQQLTASQTDPLLRSSGPVTAFAALAPDPAVDASPSTLYYATQESTGPRLWRVRLNPDPQVLLSGGQTVVVERLPISLEADVAVSSLLVLPSSSGAEMIALSTRRDVSPTLGPAKSYKVNLDTQALQELDFGGSQVLQLATHPRVPGADGAADVVAAGQRIFGVLDASNCTQKRGCPLGVLAVESDTGKVANDPSGQPMLPISYGIGLPTGLSLSTNTTLLRQGGETRDATVPLLGIVPLSNGVILFFDAQNLVPLNVAAWATDADGNELPYTATSSVSLTDVQGNSTDASADIAVEGLTYGVTPDSTYQLTMEAVLPALDGVERNADTGAFEVPYTVAADGPAVRPGDVIVLQPAGTNLQPCATDVTVASLQPGSSADTRILVPAGELPTACADFPRFQVRASGSQPLVLVGPSGSYIRRMGRGDLFTETPGAYFAHPPGYLGQATGSVVSLRYLRDLSDASTRPARDSVYSVTLASHYSPYDIAVDTANVASLTAFRLPGAVVKARVGGDQGSDYAYIIYPSANGVLQVDLSNIASGVANSAGLFPYE